MPTPLDHRGSRVGIDAARRLVTLDDHDGAYYAWRDAGLRDRILVHIDAHHDLVWRVGEGLVCIASFISQALADGLVREVFWVVPDQSWHTPDDRRIIVEQLGRLSGSYPCGTQPVVTEPDRVTTRLLGKSITVCPLQALPAFDEDVLLDIDADYMVVRHFYAECEAHRTMPWCWPEALVARLRERAVSSDFVTIAASVNGGFTPLKWKFLADELRVRLADPDAPQEGYDALARGAAAAHRGDTAAAEHHLREASGRLPASAAPDHHLAWLCLDTHRTDAARQFWRAAVAKDSTYRTPFSDGGLRCFWAGRFDDAAHEFRRALALDPDNAYAHLGLGRLAALNREWPEAEQRLLASLSLNNTIVEAHRALGYVYAEQGRHEEAIAAYERSLLLALNGHRRLWHPVGEAAPRMLDLGHCRVLAQVARLHARCGNLTQALAGLRMSMQDEDEDTASARVLLALLHARLGAWRGCTREVAEAIRRLPHALKGTGWTLAHAAAGAWRGSSQGRAIPADLR